MWAAFLRPPCGTWSKASSTMPRTSTDPCESGSTSTAVLHDKRVALQLAQRLHKREIPWAQKKFKTFCWWKTSEYRAWMLLPQVFVVHSRQCQFGSLSRRASSFILGHVGPHQLLRLRRKCHSDRKHCTCSGRPMRRLTALERGHVI